MRVQSEFFRKELHELKQPPRSGKYRRATTEAELAESSGEFTVEVGEAQPTGVAKYKATTESELAESCDEFTVEMGEAQHPGISRDCEVQCHSSRCKSEKSVRFGEPRPLGIVKYTATTKSVLAESPGELHEEAGPHGNANTVPHQNPHSQSLLVS